MNRREFLRPALAHDLDADKPLASVSSSSDLTPYTPRPDKPWNSQRAAHLLRRTGFGPTWEELAAAIASTPGALVDAMLNPGELPELPSLWTTDDPLGDQYTPEEKAQFYTSWLTQLQFWWINLMLKPGPTRLREKMTLFWHGHFVSEFPKVQVTQYMFIQNKLLREFAFGDFRELARRITIDPAMLIYLDGAGSVAGNPNENYARELMELFTLGTGFYKDGTPHYSEHDVVEMARALTGWAPQGLGSTFTPDKFDNTIKEIFGVRANFGVDPSAERNPIDLIFEQQDIDLGHKRAAIFICTKLYQFFVFEVPNMDIVLGMAQTLEQNNWQIGAVLRQLLTSEHFFEESTIGSLVKSPVDYVMGALSTFKLNVTIDVDPGNPEAHDPLRAMGFLGQTIMLPPNVKGWPVGKAWISTATLPLRVRYISLWLDPPDLPTTAPYNFLPVEFIESLPDSSDVNKVLDHLLELLLPIPISDRSRGVLLDTFLGGAPAYEWNPKDFTAKIRAALIKLTSLAEYHLM